MKTEHVPRALEEVWEWKNSIYQEVKHLPTEQALRQIMENAAKTAKELGFDVPKDTKTHLVVAEQRAKYSTSSTDNATRGKRRTNNKE